jgi:RNA polymerase sigma-70 factor, ECF subfamily
LVGRHGDAVMTAASYLVGNTEDAADVAQETFLRAWRARAGFAGQSSFRTWLLVIAANVARSQASRRRAKKRSAPEVRLDSRPREETIDIPEPDGRSCPQGQALRTELKEALEEAILALDGDSRELVVLRDLLGESYESIAAARSLPLGTVKSKIHRARLELRERLGKYLG